VQILGNSNPVNFTSAWSDAHTWSSFRSHASALQVAQVFWGVWLFPYGLVAMRSGFIPRWIGATLIAAGVGFVVASATALFFPEYLPINLDLALTAGSKLGDHGVAASVFTAHRQLGQYTLLDATSLAAEADLVVTPAFRISAFRASSARKYPLFTPLGPTRAWWRGLWPGWGSTWRSG